MKAKKKPLETLAIDELASERSEHYIKATHYEPPQPRQKGVMVESVDELVTLLKDKGLLS
jgi:hypothetical protein